MTYSNERIWLSKLLWGAKKFFTIAQHFQNDGIPKDVASSKRSKILESLSSHWWADFFDLWGQVGRFLSLQLIFQCFPKLVSLWSSYQNHGIVSVGFLLYLSTRMDLMEFC
jgi:hypothetical protein